MDELSDEIRKRIQAKRLEAIAKREAAQRKEELERIRVEEEERITQQEIEMDGDILTMMNV